MATIAPNWNFIDLSRKRHYFGHNGDRRALCGKYLLLFGSNQDGDQADDHPNNCRTCFKEREKLHAKASQ